MKYFRERIAIDSGRRHFMQDAMKEYDDTVHRPALSALYRKCEGEGGHEWAFDTTGFLPEVEFWKCKHCGKVKSVVEGKPDDESLE